MCMKSPGGHRVEPEPGPHASWKTFPQLGIRAEYRVSFSWWNAKRWRFCGRSPAAVRGLLSCQPQFLQRGSETALHAPLCHFECVSLAPSLCLPISPRLPAQRPSAMMGFSDGIKMSSPTAVTHANCIVYKVYHWEQPAICFVWRPFPFSFFYRCVIICSPAASLVNVSDMSSFNLPLLSFCSWLQVYRHSYMASYSIYNIHTR